MHMPNSYHLTFSCSDHDGSSQENQAAESAYGHHRFMSACETLLGIGTILALGAVLPGQGWGLLNVTPHPLWIVVLAIAVRYGAISGYLAGALSALSYGLLLWMRPEVRFQIVAPHDLIQPFLMFVAGAGLGELVDARERRMADLEAHCREADCALETLWQQYKTLEATKVAFERQIIFQSNSIVTLAALGKRLQSLRVSDIHSATVDLISAILDADACSLYVYHKGQLLWEAGKPEDRPDHLWAVDPNHPLISQAIGEKRVVTIRDRLIQLGSQCLDDEMILMAGPLTLPSGQFYGVLLIESMPFTAFNPSAIDRLAVILDWASMALENALRYEQAQEFADEIPWTVLSAESIYSS
jgi:hypothetical protein